MIELRGTMVDCPNPLQVGAEMIISLNLYIKTSAFTIPSTSGSGSTSGKSRTYLNEGEETLDEQMMRGRKTALNRMFKVLGLRPQITGGASNKQALEHRQTAAGLTTAGDKDKKPARSKPKTEIVGDGEEVEIDEDDGELTENQLDLIYKK
jgi:DNA repair protein RAD5